MMPWWVRVLREARAVDSWPPPRVPLLTNRPAYLPAKPPEAQMEPVWSQKVYRNFVSNVGLGSKSCKTAWQRGCWTYLPLGGEVAVTGGDTEQEGIVLEEGGGVGQDGDVRRLGRGVHLGQDLLGEGLRDLVQVGGAASLLNAGLLSLRQLADMAVEGVLVGIFVSFNWNEYGPLAFLSGRSYSRRR